MLMLLVAHSSSQWLEIVVYEHLILGNLLLLLWYTTVNSTNN